MGLFICFSIFRNIFVSTIFLPFTALLFLPKIAYMMAKQKFCPSFCRQKWEKRTAFCDHICCQISQKLAHTAFSFLYHRNLHKLGFPHICIMFDDPIVSLTLRPGQLWVAGRTRYNFMKLIRDWYNLHKNSRVNAIL